MSTLDLDRVLSRQMQLNQEDGLVVRVIRSELPSGGILGVSLPSDTADAVLVTHRDVKGTNALETTGGSMPLLAVDEVQYVGQPIALVAGADHRRVEEIAGGVDVDYERSTPQFEIEEFTPSQVVHQRVKSWGDPDAALAEAFQVVEGRYRTGIFEELVGVPPPASTAFDEDGRLRVQCATRWPHHVLKSVCLATGISADRCFVSSTSVGIPLPRGLWQSSQAASLSAIVTTTTGKPAHIEISPEESFRFSSKPPAAVIRHTTGLDQNGNPCVLDVEVFINVGAYPMFTDEIVDRALATAIGGYTAPHIRARVVALRTNIPPVDLTDGVAGSQVYFAMEMHASRIVEVAQLEPLKWRHENLLSEGPHILKPESGRGEASISAILDAVNQRSDYSRKHAAFELQKKRRDAFTGTMQASRGIGFAIVGVGSGLTGTRENTLKASVTVRLEKEGSATLLTSAVPGNLRLLETWRRIVAETLDVNTDDVTVAVPATGTCPDSGPSVFSRNLASVTRIIENCALAVQKKRFRSPLPIEVKRSYRGPRTVGWTDDSTDGDPFSVLTWAACVVEVSADPVTLRTTVKQVWLVLDAGRLLDEQHARESLELGCLRALFWAGESSVEYRKGRITAADYLGAGTPEMATSPKVNVHFITTKRRAPEKGVGEVPLACVPAAYIQAVSQATGQYLDRLPSTARTVFRYLEEE